MSVLVLWAEAELVMRVVVAQLLSSRGRRCAGGARLFLHRTQPEVLSVPGLQIVIGRPSGPILDRELRLVPTPVLIAATLRKIARPGIACLDDFGDRRRKDAAPLHAGSRVRDVGDDVVRILLEHRSERCHEAVRVGVLVSAIGGEQDALTTQDQRLPRVLPLQFVGRELR